MATTHKSWRKVNKTQFNPLWWVFLGGFNRFKLGGSNWVGFNPSNPDLKGQSLSISKKKFYNYLILEHFIKITLYLNKLKQIRTHC